MPQSGLSKRLQQHSRRSGFAVGLSMIAAVAICFAAFTWIYVHLEPWVQDFAGAEDAPPTATARPATRVAASGGGSNQPAPTRTPRPQATDGQQPIEARPTATPTEAAFAPDYVVSAGEAVNFRSEATNAAGGASVIETINPGTQLQSTGETAPADSPENGPWRQFRLEDGIEGWLREVDVSQT